MKQEKMIIRYILESEEHLERCLITYDLHSADFQVYRHLYEKILKSTIYNDYRKEFWALLDAEEKQDVREIIKMPLLKLEKLFGFYVLMKNRVVV